MKLSLIRILVTFRTNAGQPLPYYLFHYLELVDWIGRTVRDGKRGSIPASLEPNLNRLGFDEHTWFEGIRLFGRFMFQAMGSANRMRDAAKAHNRAWNRGTSACQVVFGADVRNLSASTISDVRKGKRKRVFQAL